MRDFSNLCFIDFLQYLYVFSVKDSHSFFRLLHIFSLFWVAYFSGFLFQHVHYQCVEIVLISVC